MTSLLRVQCARVDNWPLVSNHRKLPTVNDGSTQGVCAVCRQRVWVGPATAQALLADRTITLACDVCCPASVVRVNYDSDD